MKSTANKVQYSKLRTNLSGSSQASKACTLPYFYYAPVLVCPSRIAITWFNVELRGREQHCGTTPMDKRADTLLAAAQMIVGVNAVALSIPGALASVAVINSTPQAINTLASSV